MINVFGASLADSPATIAAIAEQLGTPTTRYAIPGATITEWAARIPDPGTRRGATLVVIETGGNGAPTAAQVRDVDRRLRATGAARVAWVVFADWPEASRVAPLRRSTRDIVRANASDVITVPTPPVERLASDRVHFTAAGYRELGLAIAAALQRRPSRPGVPLIGWLAMGGSVAVAGFLFWKTAK